MLFSENEDLDEVWSATCHEIRRGSLDKKHPFRFVSLSTLHNNQIQSRYVVLRSVDESFNLYCYTDSRSDKIYALENNPQLTLLFYHPSKKVQVRINAQAIAHHQNELSMQHWNHIQGIAKRAYGSSIAPGDHINYPSEAHQWPDMIDDTFFTVIQAIPSEMEVLQLNRLMHLRAKFWKTDDRWNKQWIAP